MTSTPARRSRRARSSLTQEEILDAAEAVARGGYEALSMRAVAAALGSSPMALYRYFATKDELVDALLDRVFGRLEPTEPSADWQADLKHFARAHRAMLHQHPWAIIPIFSHPNPGINAIRTGELALEVLARGGVTGDRAVIAFSGLLAFNYGWSAFTAARTELPANAKDTASNMGALLESLPHNMFPQTVGVAAALSNYGSAAHYEGALDQLIAGIAAGI